MLLIYGLSANRAYNYNTIASKAVYNHFKLN
jgi:hypothetical protein